MLKEFDLVRSDVSLFIRVKKSTHTRDLYSIEKKNSLVNSPRFEKATLKSFGKLLNLLEDSYKKVIFSKILKYRKKMERRLKEFDLAGSSVFLFKKGKDITYT